MAQMTEDEAWSFLASLPARPAVLATRRKGGGSHLVPVWYELDGRTLVFTTDAGSVKGRNLVRDAHVVMCVDDDRPPFAYVTIEGHAAVSEDAGELLHWATVIGGRYMGDDRAEAFGRRNGVPGELLVRVQPTRIVARKNVTD